MALTLVYTIGFAVLVNLMISAKMAFEFVKGRIKKAERKAGSLGAGTT